MHTASSKVVYTVHAQQCWRRDSQGEATGEIFQPIVASSHGNRQQPRNTSSVTVVGVLATLIVSVVPANLSPNNLYAVLGGDLRDDADG